MTYGGLTVVEKMTKRERDAEAVILKCLQHLKNRFAFLLHAISIFKPVAVRERIQPATDGKHLFFNATEVFKSVKFYQSEELIKQILHMLLHGIYGDFETEIDESQSLLHWVAMDFKVARMVDFLGLLKYDSFFDDELVELLGEPALYLKARNSKKFAAKVLRNQRFVKSDDHEYWARKRVKKGKAGEQEGSNRDSSELQQRAEIVEKWREVRELMFRKTGNGVGKKVGNKDGMEPEDIERKLLDGLYKGGYGLNAGAICREVFAEKTKTNDYRQILKNLLQYGECVKEEDTIDYNLYLYGLECYGDVPLIEPAEVTEKRRMNTLVLATDISGSCINEVPSFLGETAQILRDAANLVEKGKVYYLECDTEITEQVVYEDFNTAEQALSHRMVKGGGGTDFRPVFGAVEEYIKKGEKVDALFYLSDGVGEFPKEAPSYPVYYVGKKDWFEWIAEELPKWVHLITL